MVKEIGEYVIAFHSFISQLENIEQGKWYELTVSFYKVSDGKTVINGMELVETNPDEPLFAL